MLLVLRHDSHQPIQYAFTRETSAHWSWASMVWSRWNKWLSSMASRRSRERVNVCVLLPRSMTEDKIVVLQHQRPSL
ncbi:unnamed protein product [Vitrella brassicaformis CCMP3155]|uniref:Uncharacterized protein n=1 Tax=Vitrella brassicaformis (strain CCMP3155) TaxID=1169540 RepID=A0A0G4H2Z9_VITBC|nr:unnamed protein product [Vitrella brassicaformis CCMP3155]|eukprot:CEM38061.1 unnamed protein product [Vitrella brassicaformis CCMP3155]